MEGVNSDQGWKGLIIVGLINYYRCGGGQCFKYIPFFYFQRLAGATLIVFANKQDLPGSLSAEEIKDVSHPIHTLIHTCFPLPLNHIVMESSN